MLFLFICLLAACIAFSEWRQDVHADASRRLGSRK
jgi:hypothetical protein